MTQPLPRPCWVAGKAERGATEVLVRHPHDHSVIASVGTPGAEQVDSAVAAAAEVAWEFRDWAAAARAAVLRHVARRLDERVEEVAETIVAENGKPLKWALVEVRGTVAAFRVAAEQAVSWDGWRPLDEPRSGKLAIARRVPRGPVLGIAPVTLPLELVGRKIAAAVAVGAPVVVKPALRTPLSALLLGELLAETDLPPGAFSVLPVDEAITLRLVNDQRLPVVWFTGSERVGGLIADAAVRKRPVLDAGGHGVAVVCADYASDEDVDFAASRIATHGFSTKRVMVDRAVADRFVPRLVAAVRGLRTGDPYDERVDVGPMADEAAARRVLDWIGEARASGARLLTGGDHDRNVVAPTVLTDVPPEAWSQEPEGPILCVSTVDDVEALADKVTKSGISFFSRNLELALRTAATLDAKELIMGDIPHDGTKDISSAMVELTEPRVVVLPS